MRVRHVDALWMVPYTVCLHSVISLQCGRNCLHLGVRLQYFLGYAFWLYYFQQPSYSVCLCISASKVVQLVTMDNQPQPVAGNYHRCLEWYHRWPYDFPFPRYGVPNVPKGPTSRCVLPPGEYDRRRMKCRLLSNYIGACYIIWTD